MPGSVGQETWGEVLESEGEVVFLDSVLSHIKSPVEREQGQEDAPVTSEKELSITLKSSIKQSSSKKQINSSWTVLLDNRERVDMTGERSKKTM